VKPVRPLLAAAAALLVCALGFAGAFPHGSFLDYLYIGLSHGAVYAFIALGYTMVYGIIRLINFAHGEVFMAGAFGGYFVLRDAGIDRLPLPSPWPVVLAYAAAVLAGALTSGVLALLAERLCYRPIRKAGRIAALLTAVGLSLFLQNVAREWPAIGSAPRAWPDPHVWVAGADVPSPADAAYYEIVSGSTSSGEAFSNEEVVVAKGETLSAERRARLVAAGGTPVFRKAAMPPSAAKGLVVLLLTVSGVLLYFLVQKTRTGKAMRAVSEDLQAAQLMGVPVDRVIAATFFLGAVIAGVGGVAFCTTYGQVDPLTGFMPGLKAFVAAVLGGIGSIPGAVVGGLFLGTAEDLFGAYVSTQWKDALAFLLLIVVLLVKPTGLLGKERREKV
jgi:branched-chain amino acid transport system permease protein